MVYKCNHGANTMKKAVTWRFEESDLESWRKLAEAEGRSLNNWVERVLGRELVSTTPRGFYAELPSPPIEEEL